MQWLLMTLPNLSLNLLRQPNLLGHACYKTRISRFSQNMCEKDNRDNEVWYKNGLKFQCTQCGECCSGQAGSVQFSEVEGDAIAKKLKISIDEFYQRYCRRNILGQWELMEIQVPGHGLDCIFLDRKKRNGKAVCTLYDVRPLQCRTWPFWSENLEHSNAWEAAGKSCPGINTGPTTDLQSIKKLLELEAN